MYYSVTRLDLEVRAVFVRPAFELPQITSKVVTALYDSLRAKHMLGPRDFESYGGASYSDVLLVVKLFSGQGRIEVGADRLSGIFINMVYKDDDFAALVDTYLLAEEALSQVLAKDQIGVRRYTAHAWLSVEEGRESALSMLKERGSAAFGWKSPRFTDLPKNYTIKAELSDGINWATNLGLQRSVMPIGDLYFDFEAAYDLQGAFPSVVQQVQHARELFTDLLREFDLVPNTEKPAQ